MQLFSKRKTHIIRQASLVRLIQACVFIIAIGTPLIESHFIHPSFFKLIVQITEDEANRVAHRIQKQLTLNDEQGNIILSKANTQYLKTAEQDYQLWKVKIFNHAGEMLYSSSEKDLGTINQKSYFHEQVAKGENYSLLVEKDTLTLEGEKATLDVIEAYIPILHQGQFIGAFELYYDVSPSISALNEHMEWVDKMLLLLSALAILTAFIIGIGYKKVQTIREAFELELIEMATKDKLTNLYNRRSFEARLTQDIKQYISFHTELSIILFDVDHFKFINDTYGHQAGDKVLSLLANIAKNTLREKDVVARYGGEEFIILLPNTGKNGSKIIAEQLRCAVEETIFETQKHQIQLTISLGVASIRDIKKPSYDTLVKCADDALYQAKHNGRNRVCYMQTSPSAAQGSNTTNTLSGKPQLDS